MARMPKSLADKLREAIRASGMTYQEIAEKADVGKQTIAQFMSNPAKDLNMKTAEAIARAVGKPIELP